MSTCALHFIFQEPGRLPPFAATIWRGIMGMQLKRMSEGIVSCPNPPKWLLREQLYEYFMETPPPPDAPVMRRYTSAPHPYVLLGGCNMHEQHLHPGEPYHFQLRLFGRACTLTNVLILALTRGVAGGIGKTRARARLQCVLALDVNGRPTSTIFEPGGAYVPPPARSPTVPAQPAAPLRIRFESPLRLQRQGRILTPRTFTPASLLMNIVRRYSMLSLFHEGQELQADFRELKRQAESVKLMDGDLRTVDLERYSARQGRTHPLGGIMGECVLDMAGAPDLWPFLWLGQFTLAGKGTAFGLGRYRILA